MATFRLVGSEDFDATAAEFAFFVVGDTIYLNFGLLNADDTRLFESIIAGGRVGFFVSNEEVANARIVANYDADNGVGVESVPSALSVGSDYVIRWTQARPGRSAADTGDSRVPLDVTLIRKIEIDGLEEHNLTFEYHIGPDGRPGVEWGVKWYGSVAALEAGAPELPSNLSPLNVSITPPTLAETEGLHFFHLSFTPQFEGDHYIGTVLDPLPDGQQGEPDMPMLPYLVDADGNWFVDADGFILVSRAESWNYLVDADGYELRDSEGNRLVEVI